MAKTTSILRFLLVLFSIIAWRNVLAQKEGQALIDSLEKQLETGTVSENVKVDILTTLCYEYRDILPDKGIEDGLRAEKIANDNGSNKKLGEIYLGLASCFNFYNDLIKSYEYSLEAVKYNKLYKNNDLVLISELYSYSFNPNLTKRRQKALLDSALVQLNTIKDKTWYIKTIGLLGNSYRNINEKEKSDSLINIALSEAKKANLRFEVSINLSRLGSGDYTKKQYDEAIKLLMDVDAYLISIGEKRLRCENEDIIARCYYESYKKIPNPEKLILAKHHAMISLSIANAIGYARFELYNYATLKDISKEQNNIDSAYLFLQRYVTLNDSLFGQKSRARIEEIAIAQKDEIAANEIKIKNEELQNQRNIIYSVIALALLFSLSSVLIFRNFRNQKKTNGLLSIEKQRSEDLLLNILPAEVAEELKDKGTADAKYFDHVTVLFTDFVNFTEAGERMLPQQLVSELHSCFKAFDDISEKYNIEKIKTIGDAYLGVSGLPIANHYHAEDVIKAALEIRDFMLKRKKQLGDATFDIRVGIHSGSVVAGIVGVKKFAYDIWGDTVNTAARMEQHSEPSKINISETTYVIIKDKFLCTYRGEVKVKNKGYLKMYFVEGHV